MIKHRFVAWFVGLLTLAPWCTAESEPASAPQSLSAWRPAKGWEEVGAVTLDPKNPARLEAESGKGIFLSKGKADYLLTAEEFGDVEVHVEFMVSKHSNSGVYFAGSYELQIYDSFGVVKDEYPGIECGGIYPEWINNANAHGHSPRVNASLPPGQWQTFDVVFLAPRYDASGIKIAHARFVKVLHNGLLVQENVEVLGTTRSGLPEKSPGPLRLQGDHGPIAYRNIRITPLKEK